MPRHAKTDLVPVGHVVRYRYRINVLLMEQYGKLWQEAKRKMARQLNISYRTVARDCSRTMIDGRISDNRRLRKYAKYFKVSVHDLKSKNTN